MKEIGFKGARKSVMVFRVNVKPGSYHHFISLQEALFNHMGKASVRYFYYKYTVTIKSKIDLWNSILLYHMRSRFSLWPVSGPLIQLWVESSKSEGSMKWKVVDCLKWKDGSEILLRFCWCGGAHSEILE